MATSASSALTQASQEAGCGLSPHPCCIPSASKKTEGGLGLVEFPSSKYMPGQEEQRKNWGPREEGRWTVYKAVKEASLRGGTRTKWEEGRQ